jgi:N-acetylmuramoyl-L-alanine amidase
VAASAVRAFNPAVWGSNMKRRLGRGCLFFAWVLVAFCVLAWGPLGAPGAVAAASTFSYIGGDEWFAEAVEALADRGIVLGRDDGSFGPSDPVTRAEIAASLARILGLRDGVYVPFADVSPRSWYFGAVGAMYREGLISGVTPSEFSPETAVTRQQAAALVVRGLVFSLEERNQSTVDYELAEYQAPNWLVCFRDRAMIAPEQVASVANAYRLGILAGAEDGWLYPALTLTRAQMAVMLYRTFLQPVAPSRVYPAVELPAVSAYPTQAKGSEGVLVSFIESRLTFLHYPCGEVDGVYDERTRDAVMAFEKVERLERNGTAEEEVWQAIFTAQTPVPRLFASGDRVEVDLARQVLFMIKAGEVVEVVHVSTGKLGTPTGHGSVWLKQRGWVECSVGWMYFPSYFWPRIAIHGSSSVPPYPASHGCVRTPVWIAESVYEQLAMGMSVDVYY